MRRNLSVRQNCKIRVNNRMFLNQWLFIHLLLLSVLCDDQIIAMDLQKSLAGIPQKQKSVTRTPHIWVPTPKTRVPAHTTADSRVIDKADTDDRMIHPRIFKQIQKLCDHTFTLDACANRKGDNALCSCYFSAEDSFLNKDLKGEFVWLNPQFKRATDFLEAYFKQKRAYPDHVGACSLLPCWRQFPDIPELRQIALLKHFAPEIHLFNQPS